MSLDLGGQGGLLEVAESRRRESETAQMVPFGAERSMDRGSRTFGARVSINFVVWGNIRCYFNTDVLW